MMTPEMQARFDWVMVGEFRPDQFEGEDRKRYNQEASRIEREEDERI